MIFRKGNVSTAKDIFQQMTISLLRNAIYRNNEPEVVTEDETMYKGDISITKTILCTQKVLPFAFENCVNLTEVTLSGNVTTIGAGAFRGCTKLNKITIPASVKKIEAQAFEYCDNLKEITIEGCPEIGWHAFNENFTINHTN